MKYLKKFESTESSIYIDLIYKYITAFHSEKEFREWCLDKNDQGDDEDVDWDNIIGYDLPLEFGLPLYDKESSNLISKLLTDVNLDDPTYNDLRSGMVTYDEWKEIVKYNL